MLPTPPRPQDANIAPSTTPSAGGLPPPSYRLLYRGALSLPDSLMLLDGLTFATRLDSPSKHSTVRLLENPLALALESMRGRPSLRHMGTVSLRDVYLDESGSVEMDVHPLAVLSQIYFENLFCVLPFPAASTSTSTRAQRSETGIKVALGDSNGPETTHIVIFAQRTDTDPSSSSAQNTIRLLVGRITPRPVAPQSVARAPRPDDPIPRKPPAFPIPIRDLKRTASSGAALGAPLKRQRTVGEGDGVVFKVPELPRAGKGRQEGEEEDKDVFGEVVPDDEGPLPALKGKQKAEDGHEAAAMDKANKLAIKKATIEYLGRTKDPADPSRCFDKTHPEFKELYSFVQRGVGFALRGAARASLVEQVVVHRLIDMHALMYIGGRGGFAAPPR